MVSEVMSPQPRRNGTVSEVKKKINPAKDPYQTILRVMEDAEHHGLLGLTVAELLERLEKKNIKLSKEEALRTLEEMDDAEFIQSEGRSKGKMYFLTDSGINWIG